jgi:hypothetical protein
MRLPAQRGARPQTELRGTGSLLSLIPGLLQPVPRRSDPARRALAGTPSGIWSMALRTGGAWRPTVTSQQAAEGGRMARAGTTGKIGIPGARTMGIDPGGAMAMAGSMRSGHPGVLVTQTVREGPMRAATSVMIVAAVVSRMSVGAVMSLGAVMSVAAARMMTLCGTWETGPPGKMAIGAEKGARKVLLEHGTVGNCVRRQPTQQKW